MHYPFKKSITALILVSFLMLVLFSFGVMLHESGNQMTGNCPFSAMGVSVCPQDTLAVAIHHVSAYSSFFNVPTNFGPTIAIIFLLLAICVLFILFIRPPLPQRVTLARGTYTLPSANSYNKKVTHWLSLFENSPSYV